MPPRSTWKIALTISRIARHGADLPPGRQAGTARSAPLPVRQIRPVSRHKAAMLLTGGRDPHDNLQETSQLGVAPKRPDMLRFEIAS